MFKVKILEKIKSAINDNMPLQLFNSRVALFVNNVNYLQLKYYNTHLINEVYYDKLMSVSNRCRELAVANAQIQRYKHRLSTVDLPYTQKQIEYQTLALKDDIDALLFMLKQIELREMSYEQY